LDDSKLKKNYSNHNLIYLDGESEYIGFGAGSASFFMNKFFKKPQNLKDYENYIKKLNQSLNKQIPYNSEDYEKDLFINKYIFNLFDQEYFENLENIDNKKEYLKFVLTNQIRRKEGMDLEFIKNNFPFNFSEKVIFNSRDIKYNQFCEVYFNNEKNSNFFRLKFPKGALLLDHFLQMLFDEIEFRI